MLVANVVGAAVVLLGAVVLVAFVALGAVVVVLALIVAMRNGRMTRTKRCCEHLWWCVFLHCGLRAESWLS